MPELSAPSTRYRDSFCASLAESSPDERDFRYERDLSAADADDYIRPANAWSRGEDLPEGWVPVSTFWLVDGADYIDSVAIRHRLTEFMHRFGVHIGYVIRPSQRGRGYGTLICAGALDEARMLGLDRVVLTCADDNVVSTKIIERSGGVLQDKIHVGDRPVLTCRSTCHD
jgi:predicted acetyltransferase